VVFTTECVAAEKFNPSAAFILGRLLWFAPQLFQPSDDPTINRLEDNAKSTGEYF
jgi:hypothetical protein